MMAVASTSMRELQSVNEHLLAIAQLIETAEVKIYGVAKEILEEAALVPVKIYDNLSCKRLSNRLFEIYAVAVATFFKNDCHQP